LFKEDFACGMPYFLPAMQNVSKKYPLCRKELKFPPILPFLFLPDSKASCHLLRRN
jgi:hypothetical protein